ncbi:hypothetical protein RFI_11608 [Reticulomyxa filosa]|uniref:Uncharacterized protein n=1 Tax=Reticulomyxa filosa TaxID=46433 RepID=X6NJJ4_RETFI|nr:hypothetical protein RFI_11608 [Reticulomyxa filosa]|eukprot:ETO25527.1 hypothetical protein RFI_11608 [Reticulomyxa filosa]
MFDNWVLKRLFPSLDASIKTSSHPLPATASQKVFAASISGLTASIALTIALVFVPVGIVFPGLFIIFIYVFCVVKQQMKHQQMVSGVSFASYWCGQFVADFLVAIPTCALIVAMVHIFNVSAFLGDAEAPFILSIIMFLLAVLPFTYLLSLLFDSPDKAQASLAALYILLGLVLSIVTFVLMNISDETRKVNDTLSKIIFSCYFVHIRRLCYFFRASPMYCLAYSLILISFKPFAFQDDTYWTYDLTGQSFVALAVESVLYFALLLLVEYVSGFPSLMTKLGFTIDVPKAAQQELDVDVAEEQKRIRAELTEQNTLQPGATERDTVHICGLRKVYKTPDGQAPFKIAVEDLWFGIPQGQVFGFLGVNGAGKTTTLKMLTGDTHPSSGHAFIYGVPIENQIVARRLIGYCPQFDAIFDLLTAYEHLKFYGTIKGLKGKELETQIQVLLNALSLTKYRNRKAGTYSGGNKRKLSAAIAMIGNPPVVFLGFYFYFFVCLFVHVLICTCAYLWFVFAVHFCHNR